MSAAPAKKKRSKLQQRIWAIYFTLAVTLIFGVTVSWLHVKTQDRISDNQLLFLRRAIYLAAGLPMDEASKTPKPAIADADLPAWFAANVTTISNHNAKASFKVKTPEGETDSVEVLIREGSGLWGRIVTTVGYVTKQGQRELVGFAVLEQAETPGLGARIDEKWYSEQLKGKSGTLKLVPEKTRSDRPDEIDAITGATITSAAVRDILNNALQSKSDANNSTEGSRNDGSSRLKSL